MRASKQVLVAHVALYDLAHGREGALERGGDLRSRKRLRTRRKSVGNPRKERPVNRARRPVGICHCGHAGVEKRVFEGSDAACTAPLAASIAPRMATPWSPSPQAESRRQRFCSSAAMSRAAPSNIFFRIGSVSSMSFPQRSPVRGVRARPDAPRSSASATHRIIWKPAISCTVRSSSTMPPTTFAPAASAHFFAARKTIASSHGRRQRRAVYYNI